MGHSIVLASPADPALNRADEALAARLLDQLLRAGVERAVAAPVQPHAARLSSGRRGLSVVAIRAIRVFYTAHAGLEKFMGEVCKEAGFDASVCALTRSTGLSLAESLVLAAQTSEADPAGLIGEATCFFSYSWTGTRLGDMLTAIERKLVALEADDGRARYVWVDMFAASQNLLSGAYLPAGADARQALKLADPAAYAARKEDTDHIFDDALDGVRDLLLYASPLLGEWTAPPQPYLLADRGEPPAEWRRRGPGAMTRAWCMFELVSSLARGARLHVVLSPADVEGFEELLTTQFDEIAKVIAALDARDAQISKTEDREYILKSVAKLDGGLGAVTAVVCAAMREWLAAEGAAAVARLPRGTRGTSRLLMSYVRLLQDQGKLDEAAPLFREALDARRATLGDRHPDTLTSINNMASLLQAQGKLDEAAVLRREAAPR